MYSWLDLTIYKIDASLIKDIPIELLKHVEDVSYTIRLDRTNNIKIMETIDDKTHPEHYLYEKKFTC